MKDAYLELSEKTKAELKTRLASAERACRSRLFETVEAVEEALVRAVAAANLRVVPKVALHGQQLSLFSSDDVAKGRHFNKWPHPDVTGVDLLFDKKRGWDVKEVYRSSSRGATRWVHLNRTAVSYLYEDLHKSAGLVRSRVSGGEVTNEELLDVMSASPERLLAFLGDERFFKVSELTKILLDKPA